MCNFEIDSGQWAWIEEENQHRTVGTTGQSSIEGKKLAGY
jgi:hypothetical protein